MLLTSGAPLLLVGLRRVLVGLWREWDGLCRPLRDPAKALTWVRGFRLLMIGLALAGSGAVGSSIRPGLSCSHSRSGATRCLSPRSCTSRSPAGAIYSLPSRA